MASVGDWLNFLEHGMNPQPTPSKVASAISHRQWLSALADGQTDAVESACAHWAKDADARRAWHEYQLIGDVLRSEDLALKPERDQAFLLKLRERLAQEPAIVAPVPVAQPRTAPRSTRRWAFAAAAAGFVMVGGVVWMLQGLDGDQRLASAPAAGSAVLARVSTESAPDGARVTVVPAVAAPAGSSASAALGDPQWRVLDGRMIRDERLDAYLRAHRGIAAARPGAGAGRFETVVLER